MVLHLGIEDRESVLDVLCDAFHDYPVMRYVLAASGDRYPIDLRALVGMYTDLRLVRGWPVLGVCVDDELAAVALVSGPDPDPEPSQHAHIEESVRHAIGEAAWERMETFEAKSQHLEPTQPHYFVGMLGVRRTHQGTGLSRPLMHEAIRIATEDDRSDVLALSTEVASNVAYYEYLGFTVAGEADVADLHTWSLVLDTPSN